MNESLRPPPSRPESEISLEEILSESDFVPLLKVQAQPMQRLLHLLQETDPGSWSKKHYFRLVDQAQSLESYLDDYGARSNRTTAYLVEIVASLRGFGLSAYSLEHLRTRIDRYGLAEGAGKDFQEDLESTLVFLRKSLAGLIEAFVAESGRMGIENGETPMNAGQLEEAPVHHHLPANLDEAEVVQEKQKIAEVASCFIDAADQFGAMEVRKLTGLPEMQSYVKERCSEETARALESVIHNLESTYDTYIKNTPVDTSDKNLPLLRGYVAVVLHLMEFVTHQVHFYVRHENDVRDEGSKTKIAALVDKTAVLDRVVNFGLHHADRFMRFGRTVAEAILSSYTNIKTIRLSLPDDVKLHARPASLIVSVVVHYGTPVELEVEGKRCNAASIMQVMITAGTHPHAQKLVFHGDERPLRDLEVLFKGGLGEKGLGELQEQLSYLKD